MKIIIAHCAWAPDRVEHLAMMLQRIPGALVSVSYVREHASVWFRRVIELADGKPFVLLSDDVEVCDDFSRACDSLAAAAPGRMISLHCTAPVAPSLLMCGERWLESYWATGPGLLIPDPVALLEWIDSMPKWLSTGSNEDGLLNHYAWSRREPLLHCLPAIVEHRTDIRSTLGYDHHTLRQTTIFDAKPKSWPVPERPLHVACPWMSERVMARVEAACVAHVDPSPEPRVAVATPSKGGNFTEEYVSSLWNTALAIRNGTLTWLRMRWAGESVDIIRARARFQRLFLCETDCTELLWIDDDHEWSPEVIVGLVSECRNGKDIVVAPYPQKRVHWDRVAKALDAGLAPDTFTSDYPIHFMNQPEGDGNCVTVLSAGMGMMCISRRAVAAIHDEALEQPITSGEWFNDHPSGLKTANTFGFKVDPTTGFLLSDSHTLCWRWRQLAGKGLPWADGRIWLYCGPGAPINHVGRHKFVGHAQGVVGEVVT